MSGRQEVINLVQELIHDSQQIGMWHFGIRASNNVMKCVYVLFIIIYEDGTKEKEERTGDASVTGEHQHLERKQVSQSN